ncbi:hypothetical protein [Streptomyces sp. ISL-94]|uniref:hypothetical protein n=1 Tax=Streptomyces sp. ISL-94 TaxID=2819190 RepID=UPI00203655B6|nr:hypothetical protein [Streptomyces sp. ISL-94]
MGQNATQVSEPEKKGLDLSAAQVAGSSPATAAEALLASKMGVYGTILGAGVVSVVATAGARVPAGTHPGRGRAGTGEEPLTRPGPAAPAAHSPRTRRR